MVHTGGDDDGAGRDGISITQCGGECSVIIGDGIHGGVDDLYAVVAQLLLTALRELEWWCALEGDDTMDFVGEAIAGSGGINNEDTAAGADHDQCCLKAGRATADDEGIDCLHRPE